MKKIYFKFFLVLFFHLSSLNISYATIIDSKHEEKTFGEWRVFCETDLMMRVSHCKIATKFYKNIAVLSIEPTPKFLNKLVIVIPQSRVNSFLKIRVDNNDLILSNNISNKDFGLIPLIETQKQSLYNQMKKGDFLFLRFSINGHKEEITARINLQDFRNALSYYKTLNT